MQRLLCAIAAAVLTSACATIANGPTQTLIVESTPSATVKFSDCGPINPRPATTPAVVTVARRATHCRISVAAPGYQERVVQLERKLARDPDGRPSIVGGWCPSCDAVQIAAMSWIYFPILIPSLAVDFVTGAMYEVSPPRVVVELRPAVQ